MDKGLFPISERQFLKIRSVRKFIDEWENFFNRIRYEAMETASKLRKSFLYRLLRDWGYGRQWRKMYLLLGDKWTAAVDQINTSFNKKNGKLAYDLFDIHPKPLSDLGMDDACHVCQEDYSEMEAMMQ
jgi:hypothetical protein